MPRNQGAFPSECRVVSRWKSVHRVRTNSSRSPRWAQRKTETWRADLWTRWRGEGGPNGESGWETDITTCKTDGQWEFSVDSGSSAQRGGRKVQGGTYVHLWLNHGDVWQKPVQCCKVIILQLKSKKKVLRSQS